MKKQDSHCAVDAGYQDIPQGYVIPVHQSIGDRNTNGRIAIGEHYPNRCGRPPFSLILQHWIEIYVQSAIRLCEKRLLLHRLILAYRQTYCECTPLIGAGTVGRDRPADGLGQLPGNIQPQT